MNKARSYRSGSTTSPGRKKPRPGKNEAASGANLFPIVGIGASAGGLEATERLLRHVPNDLGMAYVLIQHLDPTHASHLTEILSRATGMPIAEAEDGMRVKPDHVYTIPPNTTMTLKRGALKLVPRQQIRGLYMPIDFFFRSLADTLKKRAVGVILSGTASDGAVGMKAIKATGGITFAQDPQSAKYAGMPQSSIAAGAVDFVLPPERIAEEFKKIRRHPYLMPVEGEEPESSALEPRQETDLRAILKLLGKSFSVDFNRYKQSTIQRRIRRRMALHSIETLKNYLDFLEGHSEELQSLYKDMFISVSGFFREPDAFERLQRIVFPRLIKDRADDSPLRVWVPGCSTGEEAYSIAITLLEYLEQRKKAVPFHVFATDISDDSIQKARKGRYPDDVKAEIGPKRLRRWFQRTDGGYQITKTVRDAVVFAKHDVTRDPPFSRLDLVSCRNLLIYLGAELQQRLIPLFHYALRPDGYLFLGVAETVGTFSDLFRLVDKKYKIYLRKPASVRPHFEYATERFLPESLGTGHVQKPEPQTKNAAEALKEAADLVVLNQYAPPSVLVNEDMDILQSRGRTGPYLEPAPGAATLNLLKMAREGLLPNLRSAFQQARKKRITVERTGVRVDQNGGSKVVDLCVAPVTAPFSKQLHFLVMFQEPRKPSTRAATAQPQKRLTGGEQVSQERLRQLKQELVATKSYLEAGIEKQEASNEELRSLNEEVLSSNEELQSTSEELETSNEELQSANEELTTVNEELNKRNHELSRANNDILNILNSMNLSLIIVDLQLRIRRFTPAAPVFFNLIPSDVGRPISDIRMKLRLPHLEETIRQVMAGAPPHQERVVDPEGRWYSLHIRPYTTTEKQIDGAAVALIDITNLVTSATELEKASTQLGHEIADRKEAQHQLRGVQRRLQDSEISRERDALAREMHDNMGQVLAGVVVQLEAADELVPPQHEILRHHLVKAREAARQGLAQARRSAWAWHTGGPIQPGGLVLALERLGGRLFDSTPIVFQFSVHGNPQTLRSELETNLLKFAQEALVNVLRHSAATEARVELTITKDGAGIVVQDNGKGFDLDKARSGPGFGLLSMAERVQQMGGQLLIDTGAGQGSKVQAVLPRKP